MKFAVKGNFQWFQSTIKVRHKPLPATAVCKIIQVQKIRKGKKEVSMCVCVCVLGGGGGGSTGRNGLAIPSRPGYLAADSAAGRQH